MTGREEVEEEEEEEEEERERGRGRGRGEMDELLVVRGGLQIDTGCTTPPPRILVSRVQERSPMD